MGFSSNPPSYPHLPKAFRMRTIGGTHYERRSVFQNLIGTPYNVRETLGWAWRNVWGVRKSNPCEVEPLPHRSVMNPVQPSMKLCFIGDIMDMRGYQLAIAADVKEFIQSCDFLIGNFEGTITNAKKKLPTTQVHDLSILDSLAACFTPQRTVLSVANNHAGDFPTEIFQNSLRIIKEKGFHVVGLSETPFIDISSNVRVVAASMWSNQPFPDIVSLESLDQYVQPSIFNIAYLHWGYELERFPRPDIVKEGKAILKHFDALIGHHTHVPQPVTIQKCDRHSKVLAFSLGDFCSGLKIKKYQFGILFTLEIGPGEHGIWQTGNVKWHYTKVTRSTDKTMTVTFTPEMPL
jgi:hypothetical protein